MLFNTYAKQGGLQTLLFDVERDPRETTNIAEQHPEIVKDLLADVEKYKKDQPKISYLKCLNTTDEDYSKVCNQWSDGIFKIFDSFPRFDWEK